MEKIIAKIEKQIKNEDYSFFELLEIMIQKLSNEELNSRILEMFSTDEFITEMDARGELGEAWHVYENKINKERDYSVLPKTKRKQIIAECLGLNQLGVPSDYSNEVYNLFN